MDIHLVRTNSENLDFIKLNEKLDAELAIRDGKDHSFYAQYNPDETESTEVCLLH